MGKVHMADVEMEAMIFAATPSLGEFGSFLGGCRLYRPVPPALEGHLQLR